MSITRYAKTHEWAALDPDGLVRVGISEHAQGALGDIVFVELTHEGKCVKGQEVAVVESVKAASDIYVPLSGEIVSFNTALHDTPEAINHDPLGKGWIFKIKPDNTADLETLLDTEQYESIASE